MSTEPSDAQAEPPAAAGTRGGGTADPQGPAGLPSADAAGFTGFADAAGSDPTADGGAPDPAATAPIAGGEPEAGRTGRRRRLPAIAAALAVLAAAAGGGGYLLLHRSRHPVDRAAANPARTPASSPSFGTHPNGNHFGSLRDLLLPVPAGYLPGPDDGALGNDADLTGSALTQQIDQSLAGLPGSVSKQFKQNLGAIGLQAIGVRTYRDAANGNRAIIITLEQVKPAAASALAAFDHQLLDAGKGLGAGPSVPGYPQAHCYEPTTDAKEQLAAMVCFASAGDLLATLELDGTKPLDDKDTVQLFASQLDRIKIPGMSA